MFAWDKKPTVGCYCDECKSLREKAREYKRFMECHDYWTHRIEQSGGSVHKWSIDPDRYDDEDNR